MNGLYLLTFSLVVMVGNPSWQYVKSMNRTTFDGEGLSEGWLSLRAPSMHSMSSQRWTRYVHGLGSLYTLAIHVPCYLVDLLSHW